MPPKRKGAIAENKIEAPPAKRTKGKKENKSEKTPSSLEETKEVIVRSKALVPGMKWNVMSDDQKKKFLMDSYTAFGEEIYPKLLQLSLQLSKVVEVNVIQQVSAKEVNVTVQEKGKLEENKND